MAREMGMLRVTIAKQVDIEGRSVRTSWHYSALRQAVSLPSTQPWLALGQLPGSSFLFVWLQHVSLALGPPGTAVYFSHPSPILRCLSHTRMQKLPKWVLRELQCSNLHWEQSKHVYDCPFHAVPRSRPCRGWVILCFSHLRCTPCNHWSFTVHPGRNSIQFLTMLFPQLLLD